MDPLSSPHVVTTVLTLRQAIDRLNRLPGDSLTLIVVTTEGRVVGTMTDGDSRRALLRGVSLDDPVTAAIHREFCSLADGAVDVALLRSYRQRGISLIPVIDADGRLVRIIDTRHTYTELPVRAALMAGGRGERLRPLTLTCPKPLLEVGGRPIIDHNIANIASAGIRDVTVVTNYLADMLHEHFSRPVAGIDVKCLREPRFMGTIGALSLLPADPGGTTLVMNSDLLTDISLEDLYLAHVRAGADITIAVIPYTVNVPYAILDTDADDGRVTALREKPSFTYHANAGIYLIDNSLLAALPTDARTDATDLIDSAIAAGHRVVAHPLEGTWIDIGSPADYQRACRLSEL